MISLVDLPKEIETFNRDARQAAAELFALTGTTSGHLTAANGTDLFTLLPHGVAIVRKGMLKLVYHGKLIRLFECGDLIHFPPAPTGTDLTCISEFASEVDYLDAEKLTNLIASSRRAADLYAYLASTLATITHVLCGTYIPEDSSPEIIFKQFPASSIIISQGDPALEVYLMVQGGAEVTVDHVPVGKVSTGEVFGEISFLVNSVRSATVTATSDCIVQIMRKEDFLNLLKKNPSVNIALSRTLSERLIETNRKISGHR